MLVPKPKKAFQSPGVQRAGFCFVVIVAVVVAAVVAAVVRVTSVRSVILDSPFTPTSYRPPVPIIQTYARAARTRAESVTQPKMPPWALIMRNPTSWNSGKYDAQQSLGTRHRYPRSFASRTVVCTQTSVVTPQTISVLDAAVLQNRMKVGRVERALARLVHHRLALARGQRVDDVVPALAADQDASHRTLGADAHAGRAALDLGAGRVRQVGAMALAGVNDQHALAAGRFQQRPTGGHGRLQQRNVIAQRFAEAARFQESRAACRS